MRKTNEQSIKDVLKEMVDYYRLRSRLTQTEVEHIWARAMGPAIANYTRDIKVLNKKLFVTIESAPLRQELSMGRDKILRILNEELKEEDKLLQDVIIR